MDTMLYKYIHTFLLKVGNSKNDKKNGVGTNTNIKSVNNIHKLIYNARYTTKKYTIIHMNTMLVKTQDAFKIKSEKTIQDIFSKTKLIPLKKSTVDISNGMQYMTVLRCGTGKNHKELYFIIYPIYPIWKNK